MGKKYYLFTFILFSLFHFSAVRADDLEFPLDGGTTSDGIIITKPELENLNKISGDNSFHVDGEYSEHSLQFSVTVPKGETACLKFKIALYVSPKFGGGDAVGASISFTAKLDDEAVISHSHTNTVCFQADGISIPEGKHDISLETSFTGSKVIYKGSIDDLSIHIHRFNLTQHRDPTCGKAGESHYKCGACSKDSIVVIPTPYTECLMEAVAGGTASCMSNVEKTQRCVRCSRTQTVHGGQLKPHDFDANGTCKACGLRKPKSNAEGSVYEINDASEMRVLSELVSIGDIPGNIGVDIKSDLVFSSTLPMMPLGTPDHPFQGVVNGNGHRIRGITNCYQSMDCLGFVGVAKGTLLSHAVIANLIFDAGNIMEGTACVGGIVGYASYCDILNCASFGSLKGKDYVGGIVGYAEQQVSIQNCGSVSDVSSVGNWNPMVCGMPNGHIMNSYGAADNNNQGHMDMLPTTTLRHCFSTQGSGPGLTQISMDKLTSYSMLQLLTEESESSSFMFTQDYSYPIPVVNTTIQAKANAAIPTTYSAVPRRAALSDSGSDDGAHEKDNEIEEIGIDDEANSSSRFITTIEELMHNDSIQYAGINCLYAITRSIPEGSKLYEPIKGGKMLGFESYIFPDDSAYVRMIEYDLVTADKVTPVAETIGYYSGTGERVDQYIINNGDYSLEACITLDEKNNILYEESVDGVMRPFWSIETKYDDAGNAISTNGFSHNYITGEKRLEYSHQYDSNDVVPDIDSDVYYEYYDSQNNTIHVVSSYHGSAGSDSIFTEHYIIRASDQHLIEIRSEVKTNGKTYVTSGLYFVYDDEGALLQSVVFGPVGGDSQTGEVRPTVYHEYIGDWPITLLQTTTAIQVPTVEQPSMQNRIDPNVYDIHGRMVRMATDTKDPFSGLPRGIYVYQGKKYIKRN